jgi:hypothetical protein
MLQKVNIFNGNLFIVIFLMMTMVLIHILIYIPESIINGHLRKQQKYSDIVVKLTKGALRILKVLLIARLHIF